MAILRTILLAVMATVALSSATLGQVQLGIAGGVNWATLGDVNVGSVSAAYESHTGWHAGAFVDFRLLVVGVRPGFYYVNAGPLLAGGLSGEVPTPIDELTNFDVTYVSIPLDVKVGLPLPVLQPYIFLGPEFKINTVSEDEGELANQLESVVVAGNAGLGVGVSLGQLKLYPELRIGFDISSFFGDTITIAGEEVQVDTHSATNIVARIGLGI